MSVVERDIEAARGNDHSSICTRTSLSEVERWQIGGITS